jgi:hypothetical protein
MNAASYDRCLITYHLFSTSMHKMSIESMIMIRGLREDPNIFITIFLLYFKIFLIFLKAKRVKEFQFSSFDQFFYIRWNLCRLLFAWGSMEIA